MFCYRTSFPEHSLRASALIDFQGIVQNNEVPIPFSNRREAWLPAHHRRVTLTISPVQKIGQSNLIPTSAVAGCYKIRFFLHLHLTSLPRFGVHTPRVMAYFDGDRQKLGTVERDIVAVSEHTPYEALQDETKYGRVSARA